MVAVGREAHPRIALWSNSANSMAWALKNELGEFGHSS